MFQKNKYFGCNNYRNTARFWKDKGPQINRCVVHSLTRLSRRYSRVPGLSRPILAGPEKEKCNIMISKFSTKDNQNQQPRQYCRYNSHCFFCDIYFLIEVCIIAECPRDPAQFFMVQYVFHIVADRCRQSRLNAAGMMHVGLQNKILLDYVFCLSCFFILNGKW